MKKTSFSAQPFVKWVGGKRRILDQIEPFLPDTIDDYYEPFVGGGALFFSNSDRIKRAVLTDNNLELVLTYKVIQKEPQELIKRLREHAKRHSKTYYYKVREAVKSDPIAIAARLLYLNKTCYNGLYRVNKSGKFNAPIGNYKNPNIVQEDNILACHEKLQKATIRVGDFESITPPKGSFVYFDPPYHPADEMSFTQYTEQGFTEKDQVRLRDFVAELHKNKVKVMISNSSTAFIEEIYKGKIFKKRTVMAPRFVNCKINKRGKVSELLITNYETRNKS